MTKPRRLGISGHQKLPPHTAELLDTALRELLISYEPATLVGVSCLCDGADQLFAHAVLDRGGTLQVIVPAEEYRDSLAPEAQPRYDDLISRAACVERLPFKESTETAHLAGGKAVVERSDLLVAVWDGAPARGLGGTADIVAYARQRGIPVEVIWPPGSSRD